MGMEIKSGETKEIVLGDSSRIYYTIKQIEITNMLGTAVAVLDEYSIAASTGETYKLYKTKEGNWYDMPDANKSVNQRKIMFLKVALESHLAVNKNV